MNDKLTWKSVALLWSAGDLSVWLRLMPSPTSDNSLGPDFQRQLNAVKLTLTYRPEVISIAAAGSTSNYKVQQDGISPL